MKIHTCQLCGKEIVDPATEESEAIAAEILLCEFPGHKMEDCDIVCPECYAEIMAHPITDQWRRTFKSN